MEMKKGKSITDIAKDIVKDIVKYREKKIKYRDRTHFIRLSSLDKYSTLYNNFHLKSFCIYFLKYCFPDIPIDEQKDVCTSLFANKDRAIISYSSPGGRNYYEFKVEFTDDFKNEIINYIDNENSLKNSIKKQRNLMTKKLREEILERDNYTCCICGLSQHDEPHLLLEVDHIIPVSKGGKTIKDNLQTLCWKCNRTKSNKL